MNTIRRGTVRQLAMGADGRWRGFGFVHSEGTDYFFHVSGLAAGTAFEDLDVGGLVEFSADDSSPKGPRATGVRTLA